MTLKRYEEMNAEQQLAYQIGAAEASLRQMGEGTVNDEFKEGGPVPGPGVYDMIRLNDQEECDRGFHAWVPWLLIRDRFYVTWCVRCQHREQYDL